MEAERPWQQQNVSPPHQLSGNTVRTWVSFKKEDIRAELKDGYLTIAATHDDQKNEKDASGKVIRQERYSGSCRRSFYVGNGLKQEDIKANFENGILKLMFPKEAPKAVEEAPKYIPING